MKKYVNEIYYLLGEDARKLPLLLLMFLGVSLLDIIGLGLIAPYIAIVINPNIADTDFYIILSSFFDKPLTSELVLYYASGILFLIFLLKSIAIIIINYRITKFSQDQQVRLRSVLMHTYQKLPYLVYLKRSGSEYVYNIYNLIGQFSSAVVLSGLRTISDIIVALMVFAFLAWSNIYAFILLTSILSISLFLYDKSFRKRLAKSGKTTNTASTKLSQSIHEGIDGLKEIRLLGGEDFFRQKVDMAASQIRDNQIIYRLILTSPRYILELIVVGFIVLLIVGNSFFEGGSLGLTSTLAVYGAASIRLMPIFNSFSSTINQLRFNRDTVSKLYSDLSNSIADKGHLNQSTIPPNNNAEQEEFDSLKINKVSFSYSKTNKKVLSNISIEIKRNEIIGIVGASGSGKSTLVNIMLGLLPVTKGSVEYNNTNIQECMPYFQSQIAYLPQDVFIINDSIKNNVALGLHEAEIDNKRLNNAIRKAQLSDFVNNSPMGIETVLGVNGVKISGGQRQRIALARAFYHQRNIIFMDESTSALDNETEHEIAKEIKKMKGDKTVIIISHRLSMLKYCDKIYQMDHKGVTPTDYNTITLQGEQKNDYDRNSIRRQD